MTFLKFSIPKLLTNESPVSTWVVLQNKYVFVCYSGLKNGKIIARNNVLCVLATHKYFSKNIDLSFRGKTYIVRLA